MKISACVITKNEEDNLPRCLESIQSVISEIIVVDTGSTDKTLEVATQFNAKIYNFEWVNDFSKARNYAIGKATGDWIIFLDADEWFDKKSIESFESIITLAKKQKKHAVACLLSNVNYNNELINSLLSIRIFKRDPYIRYEGSIHEYISYRRGKLQVLNATSDLRIWHSGYSPEEVIRKDKGERNRELLFKELELNPTSSDLNFYISEAYFIDGNFETGLDYALKAKEFRTWKMFGLVQKNYLNIQKVMLNKLKYPFEQNLSICKEALKDFPTFPDFNLSLAELYLLQNRYEDAIELYEVAIKHMDEVLSSQSRSYKHLDLILEDLAKLYYKSGQVKLSIENYVESLKFNKYNLGSLMSLISILSKYDPVSVIEKFLYKIYDISNPKDILYLLKASLLSTNKELSQIFFLLLDQESKESFRSEEAELLFLSGDCEACLKQFHLLYEDTKDESLLEKSFVASLLSGNDFQQEINNTISPLKKFGERLLGLNILLSEIDLQPILNVISILVSLSMEIILVEIADILKELNLCFNVAEILYKKEKYNAALEFYRMQIDNQKNIVGEEKAIILVRMAECLYYEGQLGLAIQYLKDAKISKNYNLYYLGIKISEERKDQENMFLFSSWGLQEFPDSNYFRNIQKKFPNQKDNINDLIAELRKIEYIQREERLSLVTPQHELRTFDENIETNKQLHIVYVLNHVGVCGGVKVIFEHANGLAELGAKITLVSHFPKPDWYPIDVEYRQVPFQIELAKGIPDCDIIVATYWEHISACVETGIAPVVYFEQGDFHLFEWDKLSNDFKRTVKKQYQLPVEIIAVSNQIAKLIKKQFNRDSYVCLNALSTTIFYPKNEIQNKKYMIIVGSEQTAFKGISELKEVYKTLLSNGYDIGLIWITAQPPLNPLGEVYVNPPQELIGDLYRKASVYVSGSHYEAFSLPPLEAMACGTAVVTTNNIGINEYGVDGYNCLMTKIGDIQGLANRVMMLLDDSNLYNNLVKAGMETAQKMFWNDILKSLLNFYHNISLVKLASRNKEDEWEKYYVENDFINKEDKVLADKFLMHTAAVEVLFPVVYEMIPDYPIIKWEPLARRRKRTGKNISEKVHFHVRKKQVSDEWKFKNVYKLISGGEFQKALSELKLILKKMASGSIEEVVCIRWIVLCLIKLEMFDSALELINDAYKIYPLFTDLIFLESKIHFHKGNKELENLAKEAYKTLNVSTSYPEYIGFTTFNKTDTHNNDYIQHQGKNKKGKLTPLISVMMPVYNAGKFLKSSIESILNQTEKDFEFIIINDGSTDNSEDIILDYLSLDHRIKYIKQENKGAGAARSVGLKHAQGKFIIFQDADDISLPSRFEMLKRNFTNDDIGFVHSDMLLINDRDEPIGYWQSRQMSKEQILRFLLKIGTPFNNASMMIRREIIKNLCYDPSLKIGEDTDMLSKFSLDCHSVHVSEPLLLYRRYTNNITNHNDYHILFSHVQKFINSYSLKELIPELNWNNDDIENTEAKACSILSLFLFRRGMVKDGQIWYEKSIKFKKDKDTDLFVSGIGYLALGSYDEALNNFLSISKRDHIIENYTGEAYAYLKNISNAYSHFIKTLEINPQYQEPVENLKSLGGLVGLNLVDSAWIKFNKR